MSDRETLRDQVENLWAQFHRVWGLSLDQRYTRNEWHLLQERLKELLEELGADFPSD